MRRDGVSRILLRLLVAAGLVVGGVIHLKLASQYQLAQPHGIGEGNLFRIEGVLDILVAAYVLLRGSRLAFLLGVLMGLGGLAAVVVYRYVDVPAFGPVPSMYEPIWFTSKTVSAVAEGLAGLLALGGLRRRRTAETVEDE